MVVFLTRDGTTRANTCQAIYIYIIYHHYTMSKGIRKVVEHIIKDVCTDCENKCELCNHGVCQDVVLEIGCFILHCAEKEKEEE